MGLSERDGEVEEDGEEEDCNKDGRGSERDGEVCGQPGAGIGRQTDRRQQGRVK